MGSDHDRLLSGRVQARYGKEARRRAAEALRAAMDLVLYTSMAEATEAFDGPGDDVVILTDGLDAFRLLQALRRELLEIS